MRYAHVLEAVCAPWAIREEMLCLILDTVARRVRGERLSAEEILAKVGAEPKRPEAVRRDGVAILPLHGVIVQRANLFTDISGGTSTELFGQAFAAAMADPDVQAVVLDIDSPGGSVAGVEELAQAIYGARGEKPIVAIADSLAASAAYWVGSQADEFIASPSAQVGSIGVYAAHEDWSRAEDAAGVKTTLVSAGKFKVSGNPHEPLGEDSRAVMQATVDSFYDLFIRAVARGRGASPTAVRNGYGEGRTLVADEAKREGMVDRIATLGETVKRLATPQGRRAVVNRHAAQSATAQVTAQEPATPVTAQEPAPRSLEAECLLAQLGFYNGNGGRR